MKKNITKFSLAILSVLFLTACSKYTKEETTSNRVIFDSRDLKVITTAINPNLETMSVLYGNEKAYRAALDGNGQHVSGEKYIYLTWKYIENPKWFDSNISKDLLALESINVKQDEHTDDLIYDYKIEKGNPLPVNGIQLKQGDRIAYLFDYKPSVLP
tara:strand:- start:3451 stop:3924 length:474 start_codon:yes stop_codon:yes gene_type:complete